MNENLYNGKILFECSLCNGETRTIDFSLRTKNKDGHAVDSGRSGEEEYPVFLTADKPKKEILQYLMQRHNNHLHEGELFDPDSIVDIKN